MNYLIFLEKSKFSKQNFTFLKKQKILINYYYYYYSNYKSIFVINKQYKF